MSAITWIIAHTVARALARECPRCHHTMIVPKEKLRETVRCEECAAPVPPPPAKR